MTDHLFWLTEAEFARLKPLPPDKVRGVQRADGRRVFPGIVHVLKSGCRRVDAPPEYGPRKTPYNGFVRWAGAHRQPGGPGAPFGRRWKKGGGEGARRRTFARWPDDKKPTPSRTGSAARSASS